MHSLTPNQCAVWVHTYIFCFHDLWFPAFKVDHAIWLYQKLREYSFISFKMLRNSEPLFHKHRFTAWMFSFSSKIRGRRTHYINTSPRFATSNVVTALCHKYTHSSLSSMYMCLLLRLHSLAELFVHVSHISQNHVSQNKTGRFVDVLTPYPILDLVWYPLPEINKTTVRCTCTMKYTWYCVYGITWREKTHHGHGAVCLNVVFPNRTRGSCGVLP